MDTSGIFCSSFSALSFNSISSLFNGRLLIHINDNDIAADNHLNEFESTISDNEFFKEFISNKENLSFFNTFSQDSTDNVMKEINKFIENTLQLINNQYHSDRNDNFGNFLTFKFGKKGWVCYLCNNFNFLNRKSCNRCEKPSICAVDKMSQPANYKEKVKLEIRKGDWTCLKCKNFNFAFRNRCNKCNNYKH